MSRKVGKGAKGLIDPAFCCCAIPLVNAGIYSVIVEQGVVALAAGIMAISTPDVVGASFPDFALYILTAACFIVAAVQPLGWIGVLREKTSTFRVYAWINATAVTAAFSVAAALIITSAVNHTKATAQCQLEFFTPTNGTSSGGVLGDAQMETLASQGEALCGPFAWADVGIMGGLWLILLLTQVYFLYLTKRYSTSQVSDHKLYHSVYSENPEAFTMSVLRSTRYNPNSVYSTGLPKGYQEDAWDARPSTESLREGQYQAQPGPSSYYDAGGRGDELAYQNNGAPSYECDQYQQQQFQQQYAHRGGYDQQGHMEYGRPNPEQYGYEGQHGQYQNYPNAPSYVSHPENAMARDAGDTPTMPQYSDAHGSGWGGGDGGLRRPEGVQNHPAEGMFGRKSPRLN